MTRDQAVAFIPQLTSLMPLPALERQGVMSVMMRGAARRFPTAVSGRVAFCTDQAHFQAPTFRSLMHLLLDTSFFELTEASEFERDLKLGDGFADNRGFTLPAGARAPETYSRAVLECLARRGHGSIVAPDEDSAGS
jgi:hypothetical protein